jgi:hypothetical protein
VRAVALIAAAILCGAAGLHADESDPFIVRVRLHVDRSIRSRTIMDGLEAETASLWRPYGVQIEWADATAAEAEGNALAVDALIERPLLSERAPVLGTAYIALEPSARPIHVSIDATESILATRPNNAAFGVRFVHDEELARALGRVLAHELGHVLLAMPKHAPTGLMRRAFAPKDLAAHDRVLFRLTSNDVARLRSRVLMLSSETCDF